MSPILAGTTFVRPHITLGYNNDTPNGVKSLSELLEFSAKHNSEHVFGLQARNADEGLSFSEITFGQFQRVAEQASAWLVDSGITPGRTQRADHIAPVAIFLSSDITVFMYLSALLRIGTPVLLLSARLCPASVAHLLRETRTTAVLTGSSLARVVYEARAILLAGAFDRAPTIVNAPNFFDIDQIKGEGAKIPPVYTNYNDDLDAIIMHTSGTTGAPKPTYHSQTYVLLFATCHRLPPQKEAFRFNLSTLPLYHGFGLLAPCLSLSIGMPFVLLPSIPTAKSAFMALQATSARFMLTVPSIVEDVLRWHGDDGLAILQKLDILAVGGAQIKESVTLELSRANVNLLNHWGTTETGPITPIERPWRGYDGRCVVPRTDTAMKFIRAEDGTGILRLAIKPPGWKDFHVVEDLLVPNPKDEKQFRIVGRGDDILVLATGEKVHPSVIEREIASHPCVNGAMAFGDGKFQLGIIIELRGDSVPVSVNLDAQEESLTVIDHLGLEVYIRKVNRLVESHGRIAKEMVILTRADDKPLKRTDKGTLARRDIYASFEKEIRRCYERRGVVGLLPLPMPCAEACTALRRTIRKLVREVGGQLGENLPDSTDFFAAGMDSLQASWLRNLISGRLLLTGKTRGAFCDVPADLIFANPSVDKLHSALSSIIAGVFPKPEAMVTREERRIAAMNAMVEKYKHILEILRDTVVRSEYQLRKRAYHSKETRTVLLTGSTGSIGCFLLARLAQDRTTGKVICLNRPSLAGHRTKQKEQMKKRGIELSKREWAKIVFLGCNLSDQDASLDDQVAMQLLDVTHVIHNGWPVNFSWTLSSFEPQIRWLVNLLRVALRSAQQINGRAVRFVFISSIAVVGRYPFLCTDGPFKIPERVFGPAFTVESGYAEAKWVCEALVTISNKMFNGLKGCCVRIGQVAGSEGAGVWNEKEHFPIMVRMSRELGTLPLLEGSFSWMLPDRVARSVVDLLLSQRFLAIYHVENPFRQSWKVVMQAMAELLDESTQRRRPTLIGYSEWLGQVRRLGSGPNNVAYPLLPFFERDFLRLATGDIVLDTARATEDSLTIATTSPLEKRHLEQYVRYWKSGGVL